MPEQAATKPIPSQGLFVAGPPSPSEYVRRFMRRIDFKTKAETKWVDLSPEIEQRLWEFFDAAIDHGASAALLVHGKHTRSGKCRQCGVVVP